MVSNTFNTPGLPANSIASTPCSIFMRLWISEVTSTDFSARALIASLKGPQRLPTTLISSMTMGARLRGLPWATVLLSTSVPRGRTIWRANSKPAVAENRHQLAVVELDLLEDLECGGQGLDEDGLVVVDAGRDFVEVFGRQAHEVGEGPVAFEDSEHRAVSAMGGEPGEAEVAA